MDASAEQGWKDIVDYLNEITFWSIDQWLPWQIEQAQKSEPLAFNSIGRLG